MSVKVAVVTGANKGIGYSIVKGLCTKFGGVVYLTARDEIEGEAAVKELNKIKLYPEFHQLNVEERKSIAKFRDIIKEKYGGIDILINNAAVLDMDNIYPTYEEAKEVIGANYNTLLTVEEFLYPLLRNNARVINISSDCGHLSNLRNKIWIETLSNKHVTVADVNNFVDSYLTSLKNGTFNKYDYADEGKHAEYRVAMIAVTALTMIQQRKYAAKHISINAVHPGFVQMTKGQGVFNQDDGAEAPLYLALEASPNLNGTYMWFDKTLVDWYDADGDYYCKGVW